MIKQKANQLQLESVKDVYVVDETGLLDKDNEDFIEPLLL